MSGDSAGPIRCINPAELGPPPGYSQIVEMRTARMMVEVSKLYGPDFLIEIEAVAAA